MDQIKDFGANDENDEDEVLLGFDLGLDDDQQSAAAFSASLRLMTGSVSSFVGQSNGEVNHDLLCLKCDEPGHLARNCPNKDKLKCTHCGGKHLLKNCWKKYPEKQPEHLKNKDKPKVDDPATEEAPTAPAQAQSNSASFKLSEESAGASAATAFAFMRGANP